MLPGMTRAFFPCLALCLTLSGCATFPEVNASFDPNAPAPKLLPTAELPAIAQISGADPLAARAAALRARADALRAR